MDDLYYLGNARTEAQHEEMVRLEADGICIFCWDHLEDDPGREILLRNGSWAVVKNQYPYTGTIQHLLVIPKEHVHDMTQLNFASQIGFWDIYTRAVVELGLANYGLGVRNGDPAFTGGTIRHLHIHLIEGDPETADEHPVRLKLSSSPKK